MGVPKLFHTLIQQYQHNDITNPTGYNIVQKDIGNDLPVHLYFDFNSAIYQVIKPEIKTLHWTADQMEKAGYRHYMLKEIHEQSQAIANTISGNIDPITETIRIAELKKLQNTLKNVSRISIVACGTARHAGLVGKYYFEKLARVSTDVDLALNFDIASQCLKKTRLHCSSLNQEKPLTL